MPTARELIAFEDEVAALLAEKKVLQPTHLCGGNEDALIRIFASIRQDRDWVFATYRNHYHALLFGIPQADILREILRGRSMTPLFPGRRFYTSAIVGGCLPAAVGVAMGIKRRQIDEHVYCFVGDMAATTGAYHEATKFASGHELPISFIVEDNGLACDTPTAETWGKGARISIQRYAYKRERAHLGQ